MNERDKFERLRFDGEENVAPRLYRRTYAAAGRLRTRYYGVFTDWQGKRRKVVVGKDQKAAIRKIYDLDKKNHAEVDFDAQKEKRAAREMTFSRIVAQAPEEKKRPSTWHLKHLEDFSVQRQSRRYPTTT